jgi:biotin transport system substrate-specific component
MTERFAPLASRGVRTASLVLAGSAIMALSAQLAVALPFSPVPVSGQTLGLAFVVALLGTRRAVAAMFVYLLEGASGLPVFAAHHAGAIWLVAASGGYLCSFPLSAFVMGTLLERGWDRNVVGRFAAIGLGTAVTFALGWAWLAHVLGSPSTAFAAGVAPFVPGDVAKVALAALLWPALRRGSPAATR